MSANTPKPPYFAVIFTSLRTGLGISVSYWQSEAAIAAWQRNAEHLVAQERGRDEWYSTYRTRVCRVEREYGATA